MLRSVLAFAILVASATMADAQSSPTKWSRVSDQSGSSFEVPISVVTPLADPIGLAFHANGDAIRISFQTTTESRPGFPGNDPKGDMDLKRSDCTTWPPAYYALKAKLAAYSCIKGDAVTYYIARYNASGNVRLYVTYPKTESAFWDAAVKRMAASMQQVERTEAPPK